MSDTLDKTHSKLCIECRHHMTVTHQGQTTHACTRVISTITGEPLRYACEWMRQDQGYCKGIGLLFEEQETKVHFAPAPAAASTPNVRSSKLFRGV